MPTHVKNRFPDRLCDTWRSNCRGRPPEMQLAQKHGAEELCCCLFRSANIRWTVLDAADQAHTCFRICDDLEASQISEMMDCPFLTSTVALPSKRPARWSSSASMRFLLQSLLLSSVTDTEISDVATTSTEISSSLKMLNTLARNPKFPSMRVDTISRR